MKQNECRECERNAGDTKVGHLGEIGAIPNRGGIRNGLSEAKVAVEALRRFIGSDQLAAINILFLPY